LEADNRKHWVAYAVGIGGRDAIDKFNMFDRHAHGLLTIHNQFGSQFQQDDSVQDEIKIEFFSLVSYFDDRFDPGSRFAKVRYHIPDRIVPERVLPLATLHATPLDVFHVIAS